MITHVEDGWFNPPRRDFIGMNQDEPVLIDCDSTGDIGISNINGDMIGLSWGCPLANS